MDVVYFAYANKQKAPLLHLQEEERSVHEILRSRRLKEHFIFERDSFASLESISTFLSKESHRSKLVLFHFSGHAGSDRLIFEDEEARVDGIAKLLGMCPRLQMVVLNGCSTEKQIQLLKKVGIPIVVATSAPVEDGIASKFASAFYGSLANGDKVSDAFEIASGVAIAIAPELKKDFRSVGFDKKLGSDRPIWCIYYKDNKFQEWKLPGSSKPKIDLGEIIHLVNRRDQDYHLLRYRKQMNGNLAGILYGHAHECPGDYVNSLKSRLPRLLDPTKKDIILSAQLFPLTWWTGYKNFPELNDVLEYEMAKISGANSLSASFRKIFAQNKNKPILFYSWIDLSRNENRLLDLISDYFAFWEQVENRKGLFPLIALMILEYDEKDEKSLIEKLLFRESKTTKSIRIIERHRQEREERKMFGFVLPKLQQITKTDIFNWIEEECKRLSREERKFIQRKLLTNLFESHPTGSVSMRKFYEFVNSL